MKPSVSALKRVRLIIRHKERGFFSEKQFSDGEIHNAPCQVLEAIEQKKAVDIGAVEAAINYFLLDGVRYSKGEWANDYWSAIESITKLHAFLKEFNKPRKETLFISNDEGLRKFCKKEGFLVAEILPFYFNGRIGRIQF